MSKRNRDRRGDGQRPQGRRDATDDRAGVADRNADDTEAAERAALRADLENPDDAAGAGDEYPAGPESQHERWLKYGSNVVLVSVVVVVLAVLVTWLAQHPKAHAQIDTTRLKLYSLKPQTLQVIKNLKDKDKIEIVSLYSEKEDSDDITAEQRPKMDYAGPVRDLLQEYKRNSNNIEIEIIDPVANPAKVDALIERVTNQYGGEVKRYQDFLSNWPKTFKPVKEAVARENGEVDRIQTVLESSGGGTVSLAVQSVAKLSEELDKLQSQIDRRLKQRPPDYKGATDDIRELLQPMSTLVGQIATAFERVPGVVPASQPSTKPAGAGATTQPTTGPATQPPADASADASSSASKEADAKLPPQLMAYLRESLPRYRELKRQMDDILKQISGLGELKLDELRQKLRERDAILVLGPTEMRSLSFNDVWQLDPDVKQMLRASDVSQIKPKFAGEQQITTAIWGLTAGSKKPKVVFVRSGGAPLAAAGSPFQRPGPLGLIAQRLRDYNFDVAEKDLSGQWAMQSRQMGQMMPPEPEPSDEEMKNAVWVVLDLPQQSPMGMAAPPADIGAKLSAHLDAGGSAMVLASNRGSDLAAALGKWGIQLRTDAITVHEPVKTEVQSGDFIEEAKKLPFIFVLNQYGDHLITRPMRALDAVMVGNVVLRTNPTPGATLTPLLSTPADMKVWGETDVEKALGDERTATFDPKTDISADGPMILAAAAERQGSPGRLIVVGGLDWAASGILRMPDPELIRKGVVAARFPGNAELFTNGMFWLSKMDTMIAISPSAMEVTRIKPISPGTLQFWHWGVLLIGLPLAVIAAGTMVYLGRRD